MLTDSIHEWRNAPPEVYPDVDWVPDVDWDGRKEKGEGRKDECHPYKSKLDPR